MTELDVSYGTRPHWGSSCKNALKAPPPSPRSIFSRLFAVGSGARGAASQVASRKVVSDEGGETKEEARENLHDISNTLPTKLVPPLLALKPIS